MLASARRPSDEQSPALALVAPPDRRVADAVTPLQAIKVLAAEVEGVLGLVDEAVAEQVVQQLRQLRVRFQVGSVLRQGSVCVRRVVSGA